jgi:hypothetical protein
MPVIRESGGLSDELGRDVENVLDPKAGTPARSAFRGILMATLRPAASSGEIGPPLWRAAEFRGESGIEELSASSILDRRER